MVWKYLKHVCRYVPVSFGRQRGSGSNPPPHAGGSEVSVHVHTAPGLLDLLVPPGLPWVGLGEASSGDGAPRGSSAR